MPTLIPTNPGRSFAFAQTVTLEGITIRLSFRWYPVPARWMMEVLSSDNELLGPGFLVSPGGDVWLDVRDPRVPPGRLVWVGPDPYAQDELGQTVQLIYVGSDE